MTPKEKQDHKKYIKMTHKYKKELKNLATIAGKDPFDPDPGLDMFVCFLRYMRDYYKLGYNVWAMEKKDYSSNKRKTPLTRYESLSLVLSEYEAWKNTYDKYYIYHETGGIANGNGAIINDEHVDWWFEHLLPDPKENRKAFNKEYLYHRKRFFMLTEKYFEEWSD